MRLCTLKCWYFQNFDNIFLYSYGEHDEPHSEVNQTGHLEEVDQGGVTFMDWVKYIYKCANGSPTDDEEVIKNDKKMIVRI